MSNRLANQKITSLLFTGLKKHEEISIRGKEYKIPLCQIIIDIYAIPTTTFEQINNIVCFLNDIDNDMLPLTDLKYLPEKIASLNMSPILRDIFLWQPLCWGDFENDRIRNLHTFSKKYRELALNGEYSSTRKSKILFSLQLGALKSHHDVSWECFEKLLLGKAYDLTDRELESLELCFLSYFNSFRSMASELIILNDLLPPIFEGNREERLKAYQEIISKINTTTVVVNPNLNKPFKKSNSEKYSSVYIPRNFYELAVLELYLLNEINKDLKKCKLCGKYFVPYISRSVYCDNPNPQYGNQSCKEVGPRVFYKKVRNDDPIEKKFESNKKSYDAWRARNKNEASQFDDPAEIATIKEEIEEKFKSWKANGERAIKLYKNGELSMGEAMDIIKVPEVKERSETLRKRKKEWY